MRCTSGAVVIGPVEPISTVYPSGAALAAASVPIMPPAPGRIAWASEWGSSSSISLPPRITNWSIAYWALSDKSCGWATIRTWTSGSMAWASSATSFTVKNWRIWVITTAGWPMADCRIIIARGSPFSDRDDMTPTTGRRGLDNSWTRRVRSYSRKRSRSGWKKATVRSSSTRLLPTRPKKTCSPVWSRGTPWRP